MQTVMKVVQEAHDDLSIGFKTAQSHQDVLKRYNPPETDKDVCTKEELHFHFPPETGCISK
jgi:hypothetical protein